MRVAWHTSLALHRRLLSLLCGMALLLCSQVLNILRRFIRRFPLRHPLQCCRHIWALLWLQLRRLSGQWRTARKISRGPFHPPHSDTQDPPVHYIERYGGGVESTGNFSPQPQEPLESKPISLSYMPPDASVASDHASSDFVIEIVPASPDDEIELMSIDSSGRSQRERTSDATLNDLSRQLFSLKDPSSRNASCVSVVIPAASSLRPSNNIVETGLSGGSISTMEVSKLIYPTIPSEIPRYQRNRTIEKVDAEFTLRPAQKIFSLGKLPEGWTQHTHPEGQPFFYYAAKRVITETWIWEEDAMKAIDDFIFQFEDVIRSKNLYLPEDTHLVLDCKLEPDNQFWCAYYFISHSTRTLFWLEKFEITYALSEIQGKLHLSHIKSYLEYQYWKHWELFPDVYPVTIEIIDLVANTIRDARTDVRTGSESTINYSMEVLNDMADIVDSAMRQMKRKSPSSWFVGRFMSQLSHDRFLNFHGQYGARLSRKQSIHEVKKQRRSWLITTLSPILFSAPNTHLNTMEAIWVDRLTLKGHWSDLFTKLNEQWGEHIVHASILLNANVAFLAIPSNDPSNNSDVVLTSRSYQQVASYLSVVTSFASMLLALLLVRQHKTRQRGTVDEVHTFLHKRDHHTRGLETLAIMYSLPYALLMWGMVTFLVAFLLMCLRKSSPAPQAIVSVATLSISILVVWCIWMAWEETENPWWRWLSSRLSPLKAGDEEDTVSEAGGDGSGQSVTTEKNKTPARPQQVLSTLWSRWRANAGFGSQA